MDLLLPGIVSTRASGSAITHTPLNASPTDRTTWRVSVLREPAGTGGSQAVHERLRPGDLVDVVGPRNNFALQDSPEYLFIAGGIGITPLLPMIEAAGASGARWRLLYGGRSRASMAFLRDLERHAPRCRSTRRTSAACSTSTPPSAPPARASSFYCCGPEPLLAAIPSRCAAWPAGSLHVERFQAREQPAVDPGSEQAFEVVLAASGLTLTVPAGKSVLEALEDNGIDHISRAVRASAGPVSHQGAGRHTGPPRQPAVRGRARRQ